MTALPSLRSFCFVFALQKLAMTDLIEILRFAQNDEKTQLKFDNQMLTILSVLELLRAELDWCLRSEVNANNRLKARIVSIYKTKLKAPFCLGLKYCLDQTPFLSF